jgi:hypothetical protein
MPLCRAHASARSSPTGVRWREWLENEQRCEDRLVRMRVSLLWELTRERTG